MSWSVSYNSTSEFKIDSPSSITGEIAKDQVSAGREAASLLIKSGSLGIGKDYSIQLFGHSNLEHEPEIGSAHDIIQVTVTQK